jgi:two-component system response regulator DesR
MAYTDSTPIRVVVAEDQVMVLGALAALLEMETDICVVAQACDGIQALDTVRTHKPDVLITDIEMPGLSGLDVAQRLSDQASPRIIVLTVFARPGYFRRAMEAGVAGYLLKDRPAPELADAVRRVVRGLRVVDPELAAEAWNERDPLTDRRSARYLGSPRAPYETISLIPLPNLAQPIASKQHEWRGSRDGYELAGLTIVTSRR